MVNAIKISLLATILFTLLSLRIAVEKWGVELSLTKVTEVVHVYNYKVDSYGTIRLDDKLIGISYK